MKKIKFWLGSIIMFFIFFIGMTTLVSVDIKNQDWVVFGVTYSAFLLGCFTKFNWR